jgi:hypothetical protein
MAATDAESLDSTALGLIDAFTKDLADFIRGFAGVATTVQGKTVRPTLISRFFLVPDGATYSITLTEPLYFVGAAIVYSSGYLTVVIDGSSQSENLAGTFRELRGMIGASGPDAHTLGNVHTLLPINTKISFALNTGPKLVLLTFERP